MLPQNSHSAAIDGRASSTVSYTDSDGDAVDGHDSDSERSAILPDNPTPPASHGGVGEDDVDDKKVEGGRDTSKTESAW